MRSQVLRTPRARTNGLLRQARYPRAILRSHAAEAHVSEGEIVDRAIRAYDLRSLVARIRARSDLDEDAAMALVREELHAARAERDSA
jgi:hypothetical protein